MSDSSRRRFKFSIAVLLREGKRVADALADSRIAGPVIERFTKFDVVARYAAARTLLENGGLERVAKVGAGGGLTGEKARAFSEMERLTASARRVAARAFRGNAPRLHEEFAVNDRGPSDYASEVARASTIAQSCQTHAEVLAEHGWSPRDTTELAAAVAILVDKEGAKALTQEESKAMTDARNRAANAYYDLTLDILEAARRAYPSTLVGEPGVLEARGKFRVDSFPPVDQRGEEDEEPPKEGPGGATPTA